MTMAGRLSTSRRGLLAGAAALALAPGLVRAEAPARNVAEAPVADAAGAGDSVSPYGPHQAGIVTPRPANGIVAAFTSSPPTRPRSRRSSAA